MKLFIDTADCAFLKQWASTALIDGITTNPTSLSKVEQEPRAVILDICSIMGDRDVSVEVTEREPEALYEQAKRIAGLAPNVVVKIPCAEEYAHCIGRLVKEGVRLNITLVFSVVQALYMAKLGVDYVSPFVGRLDDIDGDGLGFVADVCTAFAQYDFKTQILAASIRSVRQVHEVAQCGVDVVTVSPSVFAKGFYHPLSEKGIEKFIADWAKEGKKSFP